MANKANSVDKFARATSVVSLIVAVAAVAIPFIEQRRQFKVLQTENLTIQLNSFIDGPLRITKDNFGAIGTVIQIPWQLTLSNAGNLKLSVLRYRVTSGASPEATFYSGIDGGLYQPNGTTVGLPLVLDPGESRVLTLMIGILVPPKVYGILAAASKNPKPLTSHDANRILAKNGLDIYGESVIYEEYPGGGYVIKFGAENGKRPRFWYRAESGRGNVFVTSSQPFENVP